MSLSVPTAFAGAELEYRLQRIKSDFPRRVSRPVRRGRLAALFQPRRRANTVPSNPGVRRPQPSPHHLASR